MQIFRGIESISDFGDAVVTVGSFDGIHSGHTSLLDRLCQRAKVRGCRSLVVTFSPHPRVTLGRAEGLSLLTSDSEKAQLLGSYGVDGVLIIEFNREFSALSYQEFLVEYLLKKAAMVELVVGFNHRLGHNGGDYSNLKSVAAQYNFDITLAEEHSDSGRKISSTTIRSLLQAGEIEQANRLLAHPYLILGRSDNRGVLQTEEPLKLIPPAGRYRAEVNGALQSIVIDEKLQIWCEEVSVDLKIKIINRYEE